MKTLLYFGCVGDKGHFLWINESVKTHTLHRESAALLVSEDLLKSLDCNFVPISTREQGFYKESNIGKTLIAAWHDYSVDNRPGSNSVFIGRGFTNHEDMIDHAEKWFPTVMKRQPRPIKLKSE